MRSRGVRMLYRIVTKSEENAEVFATRSNNSESIFLFFSIIFVIDLLNISKRFLHQSSTSCLALISWFGHQRIFSEAPPRLLTYAKSISTTRMATREARNWGERTRYTSIKVKWLKITCVYELYLLYISNYYLSLILKHFYLNLLSCW